MSLRGYGIEIASLDEYDWEVSACVVTSTRIAIDWTEHGEKMHALLRSSDGVVYKGHFGCPVPEDNAEMTITRYDSKDGEVLLWAKWHITDDGSEGSCVFRLNSEWDLS